MLVSRVNETLRGLNKVNQTHSPVFSSMCQKSAQLHYFENVKHPKEKYRAKNFFAKVIRAEGKDFSFYVKATLGVSGTLMA